MLTEWSENEAFSYVKAATFVFLPISCTYSLMMRPVYRMSEP